MLGSPERTTTSQTTNSTSPSGVDRQVVVDAVALCIAAALCLVTLRMGLGIEAWRHDSLYYIDNYAEHVTTNGRWLIWLLLPLLVTIPGKVWWLLGYALFAGFAYRLARRCHMDVRAAVLFALLGIQIPSVFGQSLWPAGTFGGPLLLFVAALVVDRMRPLAFYLLFGLLFFGVSQQFYFFLPALHLPMLVAAGPGRVRETMRVLAFWLLGFIGGALIGVAFVYATSGELGLPIPEWREPHPVRDLASLLDNLVSRAQLLGEHLSLFVASPFAGLGLAGMAALGLVGRRRSEVLVRLAISGAMGLAIYAATVPIGVRIDFRTTTPMFFALLVFAFLGWPGRWHRMLYPAGVLLVLVPFWLINLDNLRWYRTVTDGYRAELERVVPGPPESYQGLVVMRGTATALQRSIEVEKGVHARYIEPMLSEPRGLELRWRASALSVGFRSVAFCGPACLRRTSHIDLSVCAQRTRHTCIHGVLNNGLLMLSFVEEGES